ncbi:MAG: DUF1223 domain-containing protein [Rhizobiales bacterium]|nr:DUF1223 domain-containing protein [Hyphomicrobiales bacterium]
MSPMILHRLMHRFSIGCVAVVALAPAVNAGEKRAVIELFTSQGCSSCPSADRLLGELSHDRTLVALSLSVDYWDYLGWKDTMSLPGHTARQRGYAKSRGDRHVYTPQAVINGVAHAVGSDKAAIDQAIAHSRSQAHTMAVPVNLSDADGRITIGLPASTSGARGEVWLCGVKKAAAVEISRGENRGRTVTYHNVVRGWHKLGDWSGKSASWTVSRSDFKAGVDEAAVIVQERPNGHPGRVLGAASIALK